MNNKLSLKNILAIISFLVIFLFICYFFSNHLSIFKSGGVKKESILVCDQTLVGGYDYLLNSINKSLFEIRTKEWKTYNAKDTGISFKYPPGTYVNDANIDHPTGEGHYSIDYPAVGSEYTIATIEVNRELPIGEGETYYGIFNNQHDIQNQINTLKTNNPKTSYSPCSLDTSINKRWISSDKSIQYPF